jgi:hypothetical protein
MTAEFEDIINEAIIKAEHVNCSFEEFVEGMREMVDTLTERFESAEEELKRLERYQDEEDSL